MSVEKNKLVRNSVFGVLQLVLSTFLMAIAIPVFIHIQGIEVYGVFSLLMVSGNLNVFANLGITFSLVKCLASQGKQLESNYDIIVSLIIVTVISVCLASIGIIFRAYILSKVLNIPPHLYHESLLLWTYLLLANIFLLMGQVFNSILDSQQKMHLTNVFQLGYNILYWVCIIIILLLGYSLAIVGLGILIVALLWCVSVGSISLYEWGSLSLMGFRTEYLRIMKKQLRYGMQIYAGSTLAFFFEPLSKVLISNFIGVAEVGIIDIAMKIRNQIWGLTSKILYPLFPALSQMKDRTTIISWVNDLEQKLFLYIIPLIAIIICIMQPLLNVWLGGNVIIIAHTAIAIVCAFLLSSIVTPYYQYLIAQDFASKTIVIQASNVVFNIVFFFIFLKPLGFTAAIIGNVAAILSSFSVTLYYQRKDFNVLIFDSIKQYVILLIIFISFVIIGLLISFELNSDILRISVIPLIILLWTILMYRRFHLITAADIYRYAGKSNTVSDIALHIFVSRR